MKRWRHVVIKGSSLPVLRIVVRDGDADVLRTALADTLESGRPLLTEAITVLDLRECERDKVGARRMVDAVSDANIRLAAVLIADGKEREDFANLDLPVIEAPLSARDQAPRTCRDPSPAAPTGRPPEQAVETPGTLPAAEHRVIPDLAPAYLTRPLRSGQRFYAQGRDLVVAAPTSRGSELIADGSIFAFSPIRGRVLAGASGNTSACIVASHLDPELAAVAGVYRTFEAGDLQHIGPAPLSVTLSLDADGGERLTLASLAPSSYMQRR
jgi:septum site-determining protein MinC